MSKRMIDSELIEALGTDINGNIIVGKNLEVGGTTKLNGGIKPIHTYSTPVIDGQSFDIDVYIQKYNSQSDTYSFMGILRNRNPVYDNSSYLVIGSYGFSYDPSKEGMISDLYACGYEDFRIAQSGNGQLLEFKYVESLNYLGVATYLTRETGQTKLYRHILTMVANTEEGDPETSIIEYISTNNLKVASLQDLTTLLKPTANFIYPLGPVVNADLGGITDYNQLEYSDSVWKFAGPASNITKINVVSVSDTVTPL